MAYNQLLEVLALLWATYTSKLGAFALALALLSGFSMYMAFRTKTLARLNAFLTTLFLLAALFIGVNAAMLVVGTNRALVPVIVSMPFAAGEVLVSALPFLMVLLWTVRQSASGRARTATQ